MFTSSKEVALRRTLAAAVGACLIAMSSLAAHPTPSVAASLATNTPTARDYDFRTEFGLTTDPAAVAMAVSTRPPSLNWGVALTDAEEADLANRVRIENELGDLRSALEADLGFAGIRINQQAGGTVEIWATSAALARVNGLVASLAPARARTNVMTAANSMAELKEIKDTLRAEALDKTALGSAINALHIDLERNRVIVGIDKARFASTASSLAARFSDQQVAYEEEAPAKEAACTRTNCLTTLRAGLAVGLPHGVCTSNFVAYSGTNYFLMTAGHCGSVGDTATHAGGTSIGTVTKNAFKNNTYADAMLIDIANSKKSNFVYVTDSVTNRPITSRMPLNGDMVGSAVCGSGIKTLFFCGSVTELDVDHLSDGGNMVLGLQVCTVDVRLGDSGGPMFYGNKAMGIIALQAGTGVQDPNGVWVWPKLMFNQIRDQEIQLGVSTYTG